jgi:hypothetical protein
MLNSCHLLIHFREKLWANTAHLATLLDIILVKNHKDKSPYEIWYKMIMASVSAISVNNFNAY